MFGQNDQNNQVVTNTDGSVMGNDQSQPISGLGMPPGQDMPAQQNYEQSYQQPASDSYVPMEQPASEITSFSPPPPASLPPLDPQDNVVYPTDDATNDLIDLKSRALGQLAPLVGHLEQTPEEKFRTTMMLIQASDDQSLIKDAYAAAQDIPDEKIKAQALLDVVNEINYFTQHGSAN